MGLDFRLPNITGTTEREQIAQIRSYLYQLAPYMQWAFATIEKLSAEDKKFDPQQNIPTNITKVAADYVTAVDIKNIDDNDTSKGFWKYRKWRSGSVDLSGFVKITPESEEALGALGDLYCSQVINVEIPFEVLNLQFAVSPTCDNCFVGGCNNVDGSKQISFKLYSFTDFATLGNNAVFVHIVASGKIKK